MPDEPLAFVEVALMQGMASSIQALLDEKAPKADPQQADAAIFYSISNTQKGLKQISFGDYLIKRVVQTLSREFPRLKIFATLSTFPGFRRWQDDLQEPVLAAALTHADVATLRAMTQQRGLQQTVDAIVAAHAGERQPKRQTRLR